MSEIKINVTLPHFKLANTDRWDEHDRVIKMNLKSAAEAIKKSKNIFQSQQAEVLKRLEDIESSQDFNFSSWRDISLLVTFILMACLFVTTVFLLYRSSKLSMIIAAAGIIPEAAAYNSTNIPRFLTYNLAETMQESLDTANVTHQSWPIKLQFDLDYHANKVQTLLLILLVSILIAILIKLVQLISRKPKSYGSTIYFNFYSTHRHTCVEIQYLPDEPERFVFLCDSMIENVQIHYTVFPVLEFSWKLEILYFFLDKNFKLKNRIRINPFMARELRRLTVAKSFSVIPVILFDAKFHPMILRKRQSRNPIPDTATVTQVQEAKVSKRIKSTGLTTVTTTAPEIH